MRGSCLQDTVSFSQSAYTRSLPGTTPDKIYIRELPLLPLSLSLTLPHPGQNCFEYKYAVNYHYPFFTHCSQQVSDETNAIQYCSKLIDDILRYATEVKYQGSFF